MCNLKIRAYRDQTSSGKYLTSNYLLKEFYFRDGFKKIANTLSAIAARGDFVLYTSRTNGLFRPGGKAIENSSYLSHLLVRNHIHTLMISKGLSAKEIQLCLKKLIKKDLIEENYSADKNNKLSINYSNTNGSLLHVESQKSHLLPWDLYKNILNTYRSKKIDIEPSKSFGQKFLRATIKFSFVYALPVVASYFILRILKANNAPEEFTDNTAAIVIPTISVLISQAINSLGYRFMWNNTKFYLGTLEKGAQPTYYKTLKANNKMKKNDDDKENDLYVYLKDAIRYSGAENKDEYYDFINNETKTFLAKKTLAHVSGILGQLEQNSSTGGSIYD